MINEMALLLLFWGEYQSKLILKDYYISLSTGTINLYKFPAISYLNKNKSNPTRL